MLERIKRALQLTDNTFDTDIASWIDAAVIDLNIAGVDTDAISAATTDAIATTAIVTYCSYQFEILHGNLDRANRLKIAYDEQKGMLSTATGYTTWG